MTLNVTVNNSNYTLKMEKDFEKNQHTGKPNVTNTD